MTTPFPKSGSGVIFFVLLSVNEDIPRKSQADSARLIWQPCLVLAALGWGLMQAMLLLSLCCVYLIHLIPILNWNIHIVLVIIILTLLYNHDMYYINLVFIVLLLWFILKVANCLLCPTVRRFTFVIWGYMIWSSMKDVGPLPWSSSPPQSSLTPGSEHRTTIKG